MKDRYWIYLIYFTFGVASGLLMNAAHNYAHQDDEWCQNEEQQWYRGDCNVNN